MFVGNRNCFILSGGRFYNIYQNVKYLYLLPTARNLIYQYPYEICQILCIKIFSAKIFIRAKCWEQPKACLSRREDQYITIYTYDDTLYHNDK